MSNKTEKILHHIHPKKGTDRLIFSTNYQAKYFPIQSVHLIDGVKWQVCVLREEEAKVMDENEAPLETGYDKKYATFTHIEFVRVQ